MGYRDNLISDYSQKGDVCLLNSYAFLLEYAGIFQSSKSIRSVFDVLAEYLKFHNTLETVNCYSSEIIKGDQKNLETEIGHAINFYCKRNGDIAGYQQIKRFHEWLVANDVIPNIDIVVVKPPIGESRSCPLTDAYDEISHYLRQGGYAALILFCTSQGAHSVFVGFEGEFFIRDGNNTEETGTSASFGFVFEKASPIWEYMIFKL